MKNFWKKTAAGIMALLIVAGASPVAPFTKTAQMATITASAEEAVSLQPDYSEWYVNMPKTGTSTLTLDDASIKTFRVYDSSGKNGSYSTNDDGYLLLTVPKGYNMKVSGYVLVYRGSSPVDYSDIYDGSSTESQSLGQFWNHSSVNTTKRTYVNVTSSSNQILLHFVSNDSGYVYDDLSGVYLTINLVAPLSLDSSADNSADISAAATAGGLYNATLSNRTIYADGEWNTLTLPFSLTADQIAASPLADFTIKELNSSTLDLEGEGMVTLNFADATAIEAGKPYIVKWHPANVDLLISNKDDWDDFADRVNNGETFEGKTVMLADNFDNSADPVTAADMVGTKDHPFMGTFDGNGRSLTVNINGTISYAAPFYCINGATIKNLRVAGSITSEGMYIAGLVGRVSDGTVSIQNCEVSAALTTKYSTATSTNNGGFVGVVFGGSLTISNCLFSGKMLKDDSITVEHTFNAGIVGYAYKGSTTVTNCLFAPTEITMSTTKSQAIAVKGSNTDDLTITNCYYNSEGSKFGNTNGGKAASTSVSTLVSALGTSNWQAVNGNAVPKMTITTTSHDDIADLKFTNVEIDAKAPVYSDDNVTFTGSYSAAKNTDSLLFNKHNNNKAFEAAFRVKNITDNGLVLRGWVAVDSERALQNNTLVLKAGKKEQGYSITVPDEITNGTVSADETIAAAGDTVTLTVTPDTGYNFKSISVNNGTVDVTDNGNGTYSFEMPGGDVTVGAEFEKQKFTVTWKNGDTVLETDENVEYGTTPGYNGTTPTKDATAQYTYTFSGWSDGTNTYAPDALPTVSGNVTYTAQFSKTVNKYTITWKNFDGSILKTEQAEYGSTPVFSGETPTREANAQFTYTFKCWHDDNWYTYYPGESFGTVSGNITYTAVFGLTTNEYTVTWVDGDGNILETENVKYGSMPSAYNGDTPTKTADAQYTYTFSGWDNELSEVTGDTTYTAQFSQTVNKYTVTWKNGDTVLETDENVEYGTTPEYNGETPTKPKDDDCTYTFSGWSPTVDTVTGNVSYTAQFTATALRGECGEKAYWKFDSETGKLTISGTGEMSDYNGGNQPWSAHKNNITSVEIENGITSIGNSAFDSCANLTSVSIPDSVTSIGVQAFDECTSLKSITIPDSVTSIRGYAFSYCTSLKSVEIPKNVTSIGKGTFYGCTSLESITIPEKVTSIGDYAFSNCISLKSIEIPDSVTSISDQTFQHCTSLTSVKMSKNVTSIGDYAFSGCTSLESITIPEKVTSIGIQTFYGCTSLESITIPEKVTSIGIQAFGDCTGLKSVTILDGVTSIGYLAFANCVRLTSIEIPDSVESIGNRTFEGCTSLASIEIPDSVTSIGKDAFYKCTNITDVYCYAEPDKLTWNEGGCNDFIRSETGKPTICHVPAEYLGKYNEKFGSSVNVTFCTSGKCGENATWTLYMETGKLTISGTGEMNDYEFGTQPWKDYQNNITSVEIEKGITSIGNFAFSECTSLASITIPNSVTSIGDSAFEVCTSLKSITIPEKVTSIGEGAFYHCTSLTSIEIPASVESIGQEAFYYCTNITDVYCYADPEKLTWDEYDCDDFIGPKNSKTTVCHVPKKYLDGYNTKFGAESESPVNVTFVGDLVDMGLGEHLYGHSITLDGSIGVNFYVELTDELLASENAEMVFTVPNGSETDTQTLLVKDVIAVDSNKVSIGSKTYYKFKCSISAKDMASEITAQLIDGEKSGTEYTYSVKDYAEYILEHNEVEEYANAAPLVKAMLNYGAASQTYFGIEGTAANAELDDADKELGEVSIPETFKFDDENATLPEGVTFEGATLSLKSETTLSLYFNGLPEDTEFTCDGKTVETAKNGDHVVARIRGIKANELENDFTVTFADDSVTYNVMTYFYNVLNDSTVDDNLKNVCKALYQYAEEASKYFGGNN